MTSFAWFKVLTPLVADLSRELSTAERYRRLLDVLRVLFPCDAVCLLRLDGEWLVPVAIDGLSRDTLGRRFRWSEHPRFKALLEAGHPICFEANSPWPDPYDGLIEGEHDGLEVHDCMGCALAIDDHPWGLLTLDAMTPNSFVPEHLELLHAVGQLAAATVAAADRIHRLTLAVRDEHLQVERYRRAAGRPGPRLQGQSPAFRRLLKDIELVACSELTVLITGETGVGKELVAQALHERSGRSARPLVSLNCAALPETLVESELFGHVRGAFTGAVSERQGKFELADGGTLFLDEVGELPLSVQAKLLRVLQSGQLQRLGSDREHRVDVRLIAATNRDLAAEVRAGRLRADMYHRLSVFPMQVPSLRERGKDVLLLCGSFLEDNRSRLGLGALRLDDSAQAALLAYDWPGNVRELEHLVARSVLRALGRLGKRPRIVTLTAADLALGPMPAAHMAAPENAAPFSALPAVAPGVAGLGLREQVEALERQLIEEGLSRHCHNWAALAREWGMDRANLARLARRLGVVPR